MNEFSQIEELKLNNNKAHFYLYELNGTDCKYYDRVLICITEFEFDCKHRRVIRRIVTSSQQWIAIQRLDDWRQLVNVVNGILPLRRIAIGRVHSTDTRSIPVLINNHLNRLESIILYHLWFDLIWFFCITINYYWLILIYYHY